MMIMMVIDYLALNSVDLNGHSLTCAENVSSTYTITSNAL